MGDLTSVELVRYENDVQHAFQAGGSALDMTVRKKDAPQAGTYKFRKFGKLDMIPRGAYGAMLNALATDHGIVDCTVSDFVLPIKTDEFEQAHSGGEAPQEQSESAMACGFGMRRQQDYSVIAALEAATPDLIVTAGAGLTIAKCLDGLVQFDTNEMRSVSGANSGDSRVHTLISEKQHRNLLADALTQSIDTSNFKSLTDAKVEGKEFAGMNFILIGTGRGTKGLQITATERRCYSYVKSAIGQAVSIAPRVKHGYEILLTSDVLVGQLSVGSVVIDEAGTVQYDCTEA